MDNKTHIVNQTSHYQMIILIIIFKQSTTHTYQLYHLPPLRLIAQTPYQFFVMIWNLEFTLSNLLLTINYIYMYMYVYIHEDIYTPIHTTTHWTTKIKNPTFVIIKAVIRLKMTSHYCKGHVLITRTKYNSRVTNRKVSYLSPCQEYHQCI